MGRSMRRLHPLAERYIEIRITSLEDELAKNPSEENTLIIGKAISELSLVLDLLKRSNPKAPL